MAPRSFVWLDVFTDQPFRGNALAVLPEADGLTEAQMRSIARELNLSETTFVSAPETAGTTHRVRIFTATRELPFAGHPTVGTAIALAEASGADDVHLVLGLTAGPTPVHVMRDPQGLRHASFVSPKVPRLAPAPESLVDVAGLVGLVDADLDPTIPAHLTDSGGTVFLVIAVRSLDALARCRSVGAAPDVVGIYVVCAVDGAWRCRMFAPEAGVVEDPATGSAGCSFAGTLHRYVPGYDADSTYEVDIRQGVEMGRASRLALSFDVSGGQIIEVRMRGAALPVLRGQLEVPGL